MGKLKVGFVLDDTLDTPDGVQQYVLTLGSWLTSQGHDVHYLVGATERTDIPNVHVLSRNLKVRFNGNRMSTPLPAGSRKIRKILETEKFDILHVQIPYSPFMARRVIKHAGPATAVIGTFHIAPESETVRKANIMLGRVLKDSLQRFAAIYSVSQAASDFAEQAYGITSTILPNVVDTKRFSEARPIAGLAEGKKRRIVFVGRLVPRKGCQILLEAVRQLRDNHTTPDFEVIICGKGPLDSELKQYVQQYNLNDKISFTGFVSEQDKAAYLKSADIAVFPSTGGESFGIVLIEAMASGRPVVLGGDNEGYRTVLAPHPTSLFPVNDPVALAQSLYGFLTDKQAAYETVDWQKMYVRKFDVAVVGSRLVARYGEALRSSGKMR